MLRTPITPWHRVPTLDHSAGFQARLCLYSTSSKAIWATVKHMKLGTRGHTAGLFSACSHRPFHVGPVQPVKKVALSSNNVRLRHAEEQSMRTSRPPGMGRRCAPRRQYRPPSGGQHPDDGAMASRPSRRSITCPWRLSGSSGPRPRNWALGGLVRPVEKIQISGKRAHAPAPRDTWRSEDPGKSRKAVKAGCKDPRDG